MNFRIEIAAAVVAASLGLIASPSAAFATSIYAAVDIGPGTVGTDINNSGTIVGYSTDTGYAFVYANGTLSTINVPGLNGYTYASAINSNGVILGSGYVNPNTYSQPFTSFVDIDGTFQLLPDSGGTTGGSAINNNGTVAGGFALNYGNFFWDAFTYSNGQFNDLGTFGSSWVTYANGINDSNLIAGYYSNPNSNQGDHAFMYYTGTYTDLGNLGGGSASANAINDADEIAGWSTLGSGANRAFLYGNNTMINLGTLPGFADSAAFGIDSGGDVVGFLSNSTSLGNLPSNHAFLYSGGVMIDLNNFLAQSIGTTLTDAVDINDSGQIIALGSNGDTYLLTPSPEPATWIEGASVLAVGLAFRLFRKN